MAVHAFDFIVLLFSFVYAAAVAHVLGSAAEIIILSRRLTLSWINAGWMLIALLTTCAWWIGLWDLHDVKVWTTGTIAFFFACASLIYVLTRMVSPRIPHDRGVDLRAFHRGEGRKYIALYCFITLVTLGTNAVLGKSLAASEWNAQNLAVAPMFAASLVAAIFIRNDRVQAATLVVEPAGWPYYYGALQLPLSG